MTGVPVGPDWFDTATAARLLGVTRRTVWRFIDAGELPATRKGKNIKVHRADIDAYLEANRVQPGSLTRLWQSRSDRSQR